jgi:hypothetical protein
MAITVNTNDQINLSVSVNGGAPISYTTNATSVSVSQPSVINVEVTSKGPKGDPGDGGGSGNTTVLYNNAEETPAAVGGIAQGSTFVNQTMQQMWDALLYPYQDPAFTSFFIQGQATTIECGDRISASPTFSWAATNTANIEDGTVSITDTTASATVSSGNDYSDTPLSTSYAAVGLDAPGTYLFRITAQNTDGGTFQKDKSYAFVFRSYAGPNISETLTENDIESLEVNVFGSAAGTFDLDALSGGYKFFAFPIYSGAFQPSSFKLDNGTNVPMVNNEGSYTTPNGNGFYYDTVSVTNSFDVTTDYAVYRTVNILNGQTIIIVS